MHTDHVITVEGLCRSYGRGRDTFDAVRGVDLHVRRGELFALLGTNGAGKTSLLEVVEGIAPATAGQVRVFGLDPYRHRARVRPRTGIMLQEAGFTADLDRYARERARVVEVFAEEWWSKQDWLSGGAIGRDEAHGFVAHAVEKLQDALTEPVA